MSHTPVVPRRLLVLLSIFALAAAALTATTAAQAKQKPRAKVVGESTTFTLTPAVMEWLDRHEVKLSVVAPATHTGPATATFPIKRIRGQVRRLRGIVQHEGGLTLTRRDRSVTLRNVVIVANGRRGYATAKVHHRRIVVFRLTNPKRSVEGDKVSLTVDLRMTARGAKWLNRRLPAADFKPGLLLGSATIAASLVSADEPAEESYADPLA